MALTTVVKAIITADATKMRKEMDKAESRMTQYAKKAVKTGKALTKSLTLPIALAGAAAVKSAVGFESSMTKIQSLVGLSADAVEGFTADVKGLAGATARAPKELADAMFFVTSAGLRGAEATDVLTASAKAAAVGLGDTATIADLATSAVNAYGSDVLTAADSTDVMVAAVREGKLEATELAGSMGRVLPVASQMGVSFNEVGAAFASMSRTGTNANEAATQLRSIMISLLKPTKQSEDALKDMGLSSAELRTQMKEQGLLSTLQTLSTEFDGNADAAAAVFGNVRALVGVMDLMGANAATTADIFGNMADVTGTLDTAFGIASETAEFKLNAAMSDIKLAFIEIGEKLIPVVVPAIQGLASWIGKLGEKFSNLTPFMQGTVMAIVGVAAAVGPLLVIGGKLILLFGKLKTAAVFLTTAIGGTAAAVAALVALPLFLWWKSNSEAAADAKERQEEITAAMVAANDPASNLVSRLEEITAEYAELAPAVEEAEATVGEFVGSNVLLAELLDKKVATAFQGLAIDQKKLDEALRTGTDTFEDIEEMAKSYAVTDEALIHTLREQEGAVGDVTSALADQFHAGEITREELGFMLDALDETADAWDDHHEALEEDAKALIGNATQQAIWVQALGASAAAVIESAGETRTYAEAAEELAEMMEYKTEATSRAIEDDEKAFQALNDLSVAEINRVNTINLHNEALEEQSAQQLELERAAEEAADALEKEREEFEAFIDRVMDATDPIWTLSEAQDALFTSSTDFVDALIASSGSIEGFSEEAMNARSAMSDMEDSFDDMIATVLETGSVEDATQSFLDWRTEIVQAAIDANATDETIQKLIDDLNILAEVANLPIEFTVRMTSLFEQQLGVSGEGLSTSQQSELMSTVLGEWGGSLAYGASGAIVRQPVLSLIGEAGPEAVVPLNQAAGASPLGGMGGDTTVLNVTVQGSVLSEMDLTDAIQAQLIRTKNRNASLEFA
jgi:TP901 family phage tail tape measure protein